ncbi:MAG TPA: PIN domain-containing protein [Candidatus Binatus sp.]|nr:PIN domain-containing protein [Candidatus Binatus sp.]
MIVVDTSVWINAFRDQESAEAHHLTDLLDRDEVAIAIPIRFEILSGARRSEQQRLSRILSALPTLYPTATTWRCIEDWLGKIKSSGDWFGFSDLLIAGIGVENHSKIWSLDNDFYRMAKLKLIDVHRP